MPNRVVYPVDRNPCFLPQSSRVLDFVDLLKLFAHIFLLVEIPNVDAEAVVVNAVDIPEK